MQGMSERRYAAHVGLSRGAIQKAKTAERLVVELRAKVGASDGSATNLTGESAPAPSGASTHRDAVAALTALGYKGADADQAVRHAALALGAKATTEALIKKALN